MGNHGYIPRGPVTMGDLRSKRQLLEVGCTKCWNVRYLDPSTLPFPDTQAVPTAHRRMRCSRCGEKAGYSRPDARVVGVDGRYPKMG